MFFDPQDIDDHEKVIAWAAGQPWCNGEVVLFGTSYYAISQVFVTARRPPALKAFFAHELCTDNFRHSMQFGGVPGSFFLGVWMGANFTDEQQAARMSSNTRALVSHLTNGALHPLLEKALHHEVPTCSPASSATSPRRTSPSGTRSGCSTGRPARTRPRRRSPGPASPPSTCPSSPCRTSATSTCTS